MVNSDHTKTSKEPLINEIMTFSKWRNWIAIPLIILGIAGLILPVLPGLAILFIGILLINPDLASSLKDKIRRWGKN